MADIGLKLSNKGVSIVEALVSISLIGLLALSMQYFTAITMTNIKVMRTEAFAKIFTSSITELFNSALICKNSMTPQNPIANGDILPRIKNKANTANLLVFPLAGLNNGEVTLQSATVSNFVNNAGNVRFNLVLTYRYASMIPNQDMVKLIPMQGTVDGGLNILTCNAGRGFNPDNLFIRLGVSGTPFNEIKTGNLRIIGNLNFLGNAGSLNRLRVTDPRVVALPALVGQGGTILIPSDRSLKENIEPLDIPKNLGEGMNAYRFNYISSKKKSIGFLAQEVREKFPNSVTRSIDGQLAVNYNSLLPQVWEYHKRVLNENVALEKRISDLKKRIDLNGKF